MYFGNVFHGGTLLLIMGSQSFPSTVPVCTTQDEKDSAYEDAKDEQRPFLAVTNEEAMPRWRAVYVMDTTGKGREEWYELSPSAVDELEEQRGRFEDYIEVDSIIETCSTADGALHGLSESDAKELAQGFADVVWDTDNWEMMTPRNSFDQ